jgi:hypothetical protein
LKDVIPEILALSSSLVSGDLLGRTLWLSVVAIALAVAAVQSCVLVTALGVLDFERIPVLKQSGDRAYN